MTIRTDPRRKCPSPWREWLNLSGAAECAASVWLYFRTAAPANRAMAPRVVCAALRPSRKS